MGTLIQDFRHSVRLLLRSPGFTAVAVLTLALGIGASTAIYTVVDAVLLRPLGFRQPDQLVMVWERNRLFAAPTNVVSPANYRDWKAQQTVFSAMSLIVDDSGNLTGSGEPEELDIADVEPEFFSLLGVQPEYGRFFTADEAVPRHVHAVILSHGLWERRFGSDPSLVGKTITIDSRAMTVVGVMPRSFPQIGRKVDLWAAYRLDPARDYRVRAGRYARVIARLKPGATVRDAQTEMGTIAARLEAAYPKFDTNWSTTVVALRDQVVGSVQKVLLVFFGAVGFVLLIACANVANLLLARATVRQREMAVRLSLGASRGRVIRQLLTESVVLAAVGGALGTLLAYWGVAALRITAPARLPRLDEIVLDTQALVFTVGVSLLCGVLFGLAPAFSGTRTSLSETLKAGVRGSHGQGAWLRHGFVAAQVALSLVLLTGAGLLMRSFLKLQAVDTGFRPQHVLTMSVNLASERYPEPQKKVAFFHEAIDRLRHIPGITAASGITFLPFGGPGAATSFTVVGGPPVAEGFQPVAEVRIVHPDYFRTMGIPLRLGRGFGTDDYRQNAPRTFIINEMMARKHFAGENPIGRQLVVEMGDTTPGTIIGVAGDIKYNTLDGEMRPMVYYCHPQLPLGFMTLVLRTEQEPEKMIASALHVIRDMDPQQPVSDVATMEDRIGKTVAQPRFQAVVLLLFAAIALSLAAVGIYGVMSYAVAQRTREIGIRMALGAREEDVLRMVLGRGMRVAGLGVLLGVPASLGLSRVMGSLLFELKPWDPLTIAAVVCAMVVVSLLACYVPARRAMGLTPTGALRYE